MEEKTKYAAPRGIEAELLSQHSHHLWCGAWREDVNVIISGLNNERLLSALQESRCWGAGLCDGQKLGI